MILLLHIHMVYTPGLLETQNMKMQERVHVIFAKKLNTEKFLTFPFVK